MKYQNQIHYQANSCLRLCFLSDAHIYFSLLLFYVTELSVVLFGQLQEHTIVL